MEDAIAHDGEDRRRHDRRRHDRRQPGLYDEIHAKRTVRCKRLDMLITPEGCMEIRTRFFPPKQCKHCPGLVNRQGERRSGEDRRRG